MEKRRTIILTSLTTFLATIVIFFVFRATAGDENPLFTTNSGSSLDASSIKKINYLLNDNIHTQRNNIITETVKQVSPAVVGINVTEIRQVKSLDPFWRLFYGDRIYNQEVKSLGSGFLISPGGYIVTNDHVAGSGTKIVVTTTTGDKYEAEVVGTDEITDVCLLKIKGSNFPYIKFSATDSLLVGEWSIALGNPFGLFDINHQPTVTVGVISSTGMHFQADQTRYYIDMVQSDASINSGNSGGPLVNCVGELIGMNTAIYSPNVGQGSVGVGWAIPASRIKKIITELKANGSVDRNFITGINIPQYYNVNEIKGVPILKVEKNSPADKAGLKNGDIITRLADYTITDHNILTRALQEYRANDVIDVEVMRENKKIVKKMKLERK